MKVSIVIPAHNAAATIHECLTACLNQTHPDCEIILADDGSCDTTAQCAEECGVTVVRQAQRGPAAARNAGAAASHGEVIAFTDSDCVPHPDWVEQLLLNMDDGVALVGGTYGIANPDSMLARMIHAEIRARHARYEGSLDFAGSYNLAVRRDKFEAVNGFDEHFTAASAEDNDLSYRILDDSYAIGYTPGAIVDHYHPTRLWRYLKSQGRHGFWRVKLYAKHPRRKSGDRYAGGLELWAPAFALVVLAAIVLSLLTLNRAIISISLVMFVALCAYRIVSAVVIRRVDKTVPMSFALLTLVLRDIARGIGLCLGVWHFLVLRRVTA